MSIKKFLELNKKTRLSIAVVGDAMVDEYYYVEANRISPEFPIIAAKSNSLEASLSLPGGAANVAYQLSHFNVRATLHCFLNEFSKNAYMGKVSFTIIGRDIEWIDHEMIEKCTYEVKTVPIKRRLYREEFPLCRWDIEEDNYGMSCEDLDKIHSKLLEAVNDPFLYQWNIGTEPDWSILPSVFIFSDYNKGFFTEETISLWLKEAKNKISIVDPKKLLNPWKGCTIMKPNAKEARELSGFSHWKDQAKYIQEKAECQAVVITQSGEGVVGIDQFEFFEYRPTKTVLANSVIGAGDCFGAVFATAIGHKMSVPEAAEIAFHAGTLYVKNRKNKPIFPQELAILDDPINGKIVDVDFLTPDIDRGRDYKLVFANGCFDAGLTKGHIDCLKFAKTKGDKLVVALNDDASVRRLKGEGRPILSLQERMEIVAALEMVDYVVSFEHDTPLEILEQIRPEVIVKGGDYSPEQVVGNHLAKIEICPKTDCLSTTEKLLEGILIDG